MRQESTHSFIHQPHLAMFRKVFIKVTKMNTNDKQFLHEPRTRKYFMILVSQKRLKQQATLYPKFSLRVSIPFTSFQC